MFGSMKGLVGGPLRLEDARFTPDDLFALNGGYDNMCLTATEHLLVQEDDDLVRAMDGMRKRVATRMRGTGLVHEDGTPSDELARALAPLSAPGFDITDAEHSGKAGLFMSEEGWTLLKKDPGFLGGWAIRSVDPNEGIDKLLSEALDLPEPKHSLWRGSGFITPNEGGEITSAINGGDAQRLRKIAFDRGLPKDALLDVMRSIPEAGDRRQHMPTSIELYACDCTGAKKLEYEKFKIPLVEEGYKRTCYAMVMPEKGFYLKQVIAPKPGDDPVGLNDSRFNDNRLFCACGFVKEGSVYGAALSMPEWYPDNVPTD